MTAVGVSFFCTPHGGNFFVVTDRSLSKCLMGVLGGGQSPIKFTFFFFLFLYGRRHNPQIPIQLLVRQRVRATEDKMAEKELLGRWSKKGRSCKKCRK